MLDGANFRCPICLVVFDPAHQWGVKQQSGYTECFGADTVFLRVLGSNKEV